MVTACLVHTLKIKKKLKKGFKLIWLCFVCISLNVYKIAKNCPCLLNGIVH